MSSVALDVVIQVITNDEDDIGAFGSSSLRPAGHTQASASENGHHSHFLFLSITANLLDDPRQAHVRSMRTV
jgi:hypothetical protein